MIEIAKAIEAKRFVVGKDRTLKLLKANEIEKVFLASNCPALWKKLFQSIARIAGVQLIQIDKNSSEFGEFCKKPFAITVAGIRKEKH